MAKQADVELRIRSRDLSKNSIEQVTKEIDALNAKLLQQRDAAKLAATSVKQLKDQQKLLADASANLNARRGDIENLQRQQTEIAQTTAALNKYRAELADLRRIQRSGSFLGDIDKALKTVERSVKSSTALLNRQQGAFNKAADRAREYGVDLNDLGESLKKVERLQEQVTASSNEAAASFDRREKAIEELTAAEKRQIALQREAITEAKRRAAIETAAAEARIHAVKEEIAVRAQRAQRGREAVETFEIDFQREVTAEVKRRAAIETAEHAKRVREIHERRAAEAAAAARRQQAMETFAAASKQQLRNPMSRDAVVQEQRLLATRRQLAPATDAVSRRTREAADAQRRLNAQQRTALSFNQRLRGQILSIAAAYFGVFEAINVVRKAIATDIERQGTAMRLQVAADGDVSQAGRDFEYIREQADRLGQRLDPLAAQYSKFAIAAQGAGQSLETTRQVFEDFAEVGTVLQLSQENMDGIFKALEQSFSKGIIQAEELRGQLGDRLPGAFTKLAKAIGISNGELTKLMENGELTADVLPLLAEFMADEVAANLPQATANVRAELAKMRTAFDDFLVTLSRGGLGDAVRELAIELADFFQSEDGRQFAEDLAQSFSLAVDAIRGVISVLGGPSGVISLFKVLIAIQVARWAGLWLSSIGAMVVQMRTLATTMTATGVAARTMGTRIMAALGPIGIALALASEAFIYFKLKSDAAADSAEEQADRVDQLRTAQGRALQTALALAEQDLENAKAARDAAVAKREQARATLENARAQLAELQAQGKFLENAGFIKGERQTRTSSEAQRLAREYTAAQKAIKEAEVAIRDFETKSAGVGVARARLMRESQQNESTALKQFNALQVELTDKTNRRRFLSDKKYYDEVNDRARAAYATLGEASRDFVKQSTVDQQEALQATLGRLRAERTGIDFSRLDKKDDDKARKAREKAAREAERAARAAEAAEQKRLDLGNKTREALLAIEREIAESRINIDATTNEQIDANLHQRLAILDAEIKKRLSDLEELRRDAEKFGDASAVADVDKAVAGVGTLHASEVAKLQREAVQEKFRAQEEELNKLIDERAAKLEYINALREAGQLTEIEAAQQARDATLEGQDAIAAKAQQLRDFLIANQGLLGQMLNIPAVLLQLDALALKINTGVTASQKFLYTWRDEIATGIADTFGALAAGLADFIKGTGSLSDAFKSAGDAFLDFAADFLVNIGKMIIQAIILKAIQNALTPGASGGYWNAAMGAIGVAHNGAMVGAPIGSSMAVSPLAFIGAPRYHNGGFPGLRSDEVPIIAQTGEEILSRTDSRNAMNGGAASAAPNLKIINAIDSASVVNEAMNRRDGQQPVINMIRARKAEIKQILGV